MSLINVIHTSSCSITFSQFPEGRFAKKCMSAGKIYKFVFMPVCTCIQGRCLPYMTMESLLMMEQPKVSQACSLHCHWGLNIPPLMSKPPPIIYRRRILTLWWLSSFFFLNISLIIGDLNSVIPACITIGIYKFDIHCMLPKVGIVLRVERLIKTNDLPDNPTEPGRYRL